MNLPRIVPYLLYVNYAGDNPERFVKRHAEKLLEAEERFGRKVEQLKKENAQEKKRSYYFEKTENVIARSVQVELRTQRGL